ncbi:MAG: exodeoxyribonuclease VII large subunit, partial [Deltaproteobacteria bacterium]|nr:exodeoxyribonuclease VII large subunit [Deltaproteobacteria bacterium]
GRGGGAIEDLWAFNDERVVRAVALCPVPTVSAVGHETDVTLTDFAADLRASTPSAAAELIVPDRHELAESVLHLNARLKSSIRHTVARHSELVRQVLKRLYDPRRHIQEKRMRTDELAMRLGNAMTRRLSLLSQEARGVAQRLRPGHLMRAIEMARQACEGHYGDLVRSMGDVLAHARSAVETISLQLESLSPLKVLQRGYSITFRADSGNVITDSDSVQTGDDVRIRLHRGELSCKVTAKQRSRDELS